MGSGWSDGTGCLSWQSLIITIASCSSLMQELSCSLNFDSHTGRGKLSLANPRYSGLRGDTLSGGFRWERDVIRLEKLVLQQQRSRYGRPEKQRDSRDLLCVLNNFKHPDDARLTCRYEVQGEYNIPPTTP